MSNWLATSADKKDRHQLAFHMLSDLLKRNASFLSRKQFNQLFRIRCLLDTDVWITDEDKEWVEKELGRLSGDKQK